MIKLLPAKEFLILEKVLLCDASGKVFDKKTGSTLKVGVKQKKRSMKDQNLVD